MNHVEQRGQPMVFLSGHFPGPHSGWFTLKKEPFEIMDTVDQIRWILATSNGFDLFKDYLNHSFLFDSLDVV